MSPAEMLEIFDAVGGMITRYVAQADEKWQARFDQFNADLVTKFGDVEAGANPEALADPDFQFVIREAQNAYGRRGDEELREELVKLLSDRSKETGGSRKALILNDAISIVGKLTPTEISALVILFMFRQVGMRQSTYQNVTNAFSELITPFLADFPQDDFSYEYLESVRCVTINQISRVNLWDVFTGQFSHLYTDGFTRAELDEVIGGLSNKPNLNHLVEPIPNNFLGRMRFNLIRSDLEKALTGLGGGDLNSAVLGLFDQKAFDRTRIQDEFFAAIPGFQRVSELWETTLARQSNITALGKVVAHSALTSRTPFKAALDIWIK